MRPRWILVSISCGLLAACGGARPQATGPEDTAACRSACERAAEAWAAVATSAEAAAHPTGETPLAAEQALDRLEEHVASLSATPREVDGDEAFALSSAMMDAVDAVGTQISAQLRDRADAAAEAILTDRGEQGALRAARDATEVLEQVLQAAHPGSLEERSQRRAMASLGRRAQAAADAYREDGPERGDLRADRGEAIALPEGSPEVLRSTRERAEDASTAVRRECHIERRLSVPTL